MKIGNAIHITIYDLLYVVVVICILLGYLFIFIYGDCDMLIRVIVNFIFTVLGACIYISFFYLISYYGCVDDCLLGVNMLVIFTILVCAAGVIILWRQRERSAIVHIEI